MFFLRYNILATHRTPKQRQRKHFHFHCSRHGIFFKFKKRNVSTRKAWMSELERNTLAYLWRYGLFLKFSQSDQWFNNIAISTFLHSTAVDLPSSYSDRYLKTNTSTRNCLPAPSSITRSPPSWAIPLRIVLPWEKNIAQLDSFTELKKKWSWRASGLLLTVQMPRDRNFFHGCSRYFSQPFRSLPYQIIHIFFWIRMAKTFLKNSDTQWRYFSIKLKKMKVLSTLAVPDFFLWIQLDLY